MVKQNKAFIIDGGAEIKASLLWDEETDAWTYYSGPPETGDEYYRTIPVLYRGLEIIQDAIQKVPFTIYKGDAEYDTSKDWKNKLEFLPNPRRTFALISRSLDKQGKAYLLKNANKAGYVKELKWFVPSSIEAKIDEEKGLEKFIRHLAMRDIPYKPEEILYFWLPDDDVEIGPPLAWPMKSALISCGVLSNLDLFIAKYFERGAIRPTIISAKGMPSKEERERLETWFNRLMGGIKKAFQWKVFNAETLDIKQIGDGLDQLQNLTLTEDQRANVALALGIPQTILFANSANFATSMSDRRNFYDDKIMPRLEFIASTMNEQVLQPMGYQLEFDPNSLDIYQEDEKERSTSLGQLTGAGVPLLMSMDLLGYELTDEQRAELEKAEEEKEVQAEQMQEQLQGQPAQGEEPEEEPMSAEAEKELKRWRRSCLEQFRKNKPIPADWQPEAINVDYASTITEALKAAKSADDIKAAFEATYSAAPLPVTDWLAYTPLYDELKRANDLLEKVKSV